MKKCFDISRLFLLQKYLKSILLPDQKYLCCKIVDWSKNKIIPLDWLHNDGHLCWDIYKLVWISKDACLHFQENFLSFIEDPNNRIIICFNYQKASDGAIEGFTKIEGPSLSGWRKSTCYCLGQILKITPR